VQLHTKHDFILGHVVSDADIETDPSKIEKNKSGTLQDEQMNLKLLFVLVDTIEVSSKTFRKSPNRLHIYFQQLQPNERRSSLGISTCKFQL